MGYFNGIALLNALLVFLNFPDVFRANTNEEDVESNERGKQSPKKKLDRVSQGQGNDTSVSKT